MIKVSLKPFMGAVFLAGTAFGPAHAQQAGEAHQIPGQGLGPGLFNPDSSADSSEVLDRLFGQLRQAEAWQQRERKKPRRVANG